MSCIPRAVSLLLENPWEECKNEQARNLKHKSRARVAKPRVAQVPEGEVRRKDMTTRDEIYGERLVDLLTSRA